MKQTSVSLVLLLVAVCVRGSLAFSNRKLLDSAGALVDELESLRQRLVSSTGFSQPQWARKLQQDYSTGSYYGGYGYGYYYGGYYSGASPYTMSTARRSLLSTAGSASHLRQLKQAPYPDPYGSYYGSYYGYGYYYGSYPASDPYAPMPSTGRRRSMLSTVENLSEILTDELDGFIDPSAIVLDPRRDLKAAGSWASADYGYSYGYGYYYGYGGYASPY